MEVNECDKETEESNKYLLIWDEREEGILINTYYYYNRPRLRLCQDSKY